MLGNTATLAETLMGQVGGGELSDFLTESEETEGTDLKPLGTAGRGLTYPGTEDVPEFFDSGMGIDILGAVVGGIMGGFMPTPPAVPVAAAAPAGASAAEIAAIFAAREKKGMPTWGWIAIGGGGLTFVMLLVTLLLKK